MTTKKTWNLKLTVEDVFDLSSEYTKKCNAKNILENNKTTHLFQVYSSPKEWVVTNMTEISNFFKFSKSDLPEKNNARDMILKLLSAVARVHLQCYDEATIRHEPYVFSVPDFYESGKFKYGIIYPIQNNNKILNLLVAEWDIGISDSPEQKISPWEKNSIIIEDKQEDLFNFSKYKKIKLMDQFEYFKIKDWKSRKAYQDKTSSVTEIDDFKAGKILDPNLYNSKSYLYNKINYIEWAKGIKKWFMPKGTDYIATTNLLKKFDNIKK